MSEIGTTLAELQNWLTLEDPSHQRIVDRVGSLLRSVRREALEEAAGVAKTIAKGYYGDLCFKAEIEQAIRELIDKESLKQSTKEGKNA